ELGFPPDRPDVEASMLELLRAARRAGAKVVRCDGDAWYTQMLGPDRHYVGLGDYLDLIHHCHPLVLDGMPPQHADRVFCWPWPFTLPPLEGVPASIPRACFIGSAHNPGLSRLMWWAECGARALPIDFFMTLGQRGEQMSDVDYYSRLRTYALSANFSRRATGVGILTGRATETMLVGGVLLDEDTVDMRYFKMPGVHYLPFRTIDDLAGLIDGLLADPARRRRIAADGQAWAARYFTGDHFWAGMLARLWG
ncbi:MAG: glycosyltransferase family 1 protein, partial [Alphaproteobacteria bacterium]|nr:glycosyltransferase family 1 protein [Alphaproteobacteria bacterium]